MAEGCTTSFDITLTNNRAILNLMQVARGWGSCEGGCSLSQEAASGSRGRAPCHQMPGWQEAGTAALQMRTMWNHMVRTVVLTMSSCPHHIFKLQLSKVNPTSPPASCLYNCIDFQVLTLLYECMVHVQGWLRQDPEF